MDWLEERGWISSGAVHPLHTVVFTVREGARQNAGAEAGGGGARGGGAGGGGAGGGGAGGGGAGSCCDARVGGREGRVGCPDAW